MNSTFAELGVPADLVSVLARRGVDAPFPIQAAALPDALAGFDVCGKAPTGSGKTLAFGLALVLRTSPGKMRKPRGLVLVPTRELAAQVAEELTPLAEARGKSVVVIYGGTGYDRQRKLLRRRPDIVVACPGRLEDLAQQRDIDLSDVDVVVVDEADRMADMGFLPAVRRILDATRSVRQTMLFSATLDGEVDVLVRHYQEKPRRHDVSDDQDGIETEHFFWAAERENRVSITAQLVDRHERAIVFCRTRHGADRLARQLIDAGVSAAPIHGNRTQAQRDKALAAFKGGRVQALVATDVAARGIHVDAVPCVVHFDPPADHKDYLHRSGRTGRAGASGTVVSLVGRDQRTAVRALQRSLGMELGVDQPDDPGLNSRIRRTEPHGRPGASATPPSARPAASGPRRNNGMVPADRSARPKRPQWAARSRRRAS